MGFVGLTLLKKMKQTIREYLFEGLWGSVGFVEDCGFYSPQYTQYGPIKNGRIKNQGSDFEKK